MLLIHHEVKASVIKEVITAFVPLKDMGDGHLLVDRIAALGQPDISQRMIQVFQKSLLRGAAERLNAQRPGCRLLGCNRRGSVGPHILRQFV